MQALDTIGCGDELVFKGSKLPCMTQATRTATIAQIPFARLKPYTKHPYGLIIPQVLTEQILAQKLASFGVTVHRPYRVIGMKPNSNDAKLADVTFEDGQVISTEYIIAADGARSTVSTSVLSWHDRLFVFMIYRLDSRNRWDQLRRPDERKH